MPILAPRLSDEGNKYFTNLSLGFSQSMKPVTLSQRQQIFSHNVSKLITFIYSSGYSCTLGEAFRSPEQAEIYAKQGKGIADSLHCHRLAIDLDLFDKDNNYLDKTESYKQFGDYWKTLHPFNRWGGVFISRPDGNHFEMQDL